MTKLELAKTLLNEWEEESNQLKGEVVDLQDTNAELEDEKDTLEEDKTDLESNKSYLEDELDTAKSESNDNYDRLTGLNASVTTLCEKIPELYHEEFDPIKDETERIRKEIDDYLDPPESDEPEEPKDPKEVLESMRDAISEVHSLLCASEDTLYSEWKDLVADTKDYC